MTGRKEDNVSGQVWLKVVLVTHVIRRLNLHKLFIGLFILIGIRMPLLGELRVNTKGEKSVRFSRGGWGPCLPGNKSS